MKKSPRRESRRSTGIFQNIFQQSIINSLAADDPENPQNQLKDPPKEVSLTPAYSSSSTSLCSPAPGSYPARNIPKIDTTKDVNVRTENEFNEFCALRDLPADKDVLFLFPH